MFSSRRGVNKNIIDVEEINAVVDGIVDVPITTASIVFCHHHQNLECIFWFVVVWLSIYNSKIEHEMYLQSNLATLILNTIPFYILLQNSFWNEKLISLLLFNSICPLLHNFICYCLILQ